jgi:uncharacterized Tic20 family protein
MDTPELPTNPNNMPTEDELNMAMLAHLSALILGVVGPLIFWVVKKDESPYVDMVGKTALNFQISYLIYFFVAGLLSLVLIGLLFLLVLGPMWLVLVIVAAVKAKNGENYKPLLTIDFLK